MLEVLQIGWGKLACEPLSCGSRFQKKLSGEKVKEANVVSIPYWEDCGATFVIVWLLQALAMFVECSYMIYTQQIPIGSPWKVLVHLFFLIHPQKSETLMSYPWLWTHILTLVTYGRTSPNTF